jgi:hypothetical protein
MSRATLPTQEIRAYLERRRDALNDAVRRYPTPIARCDVQLTAILDTRAEVLRLLREDERALPAAFAAVASRFVDDPLDDEAQGVAGLGSTGLPVST